MIREEVTKLVVMFRDTEGEPSAMDINVQRERFAGLVGLGEENSVRKLRSAWVGLQ